MKDGVRRYAVVEMLTNVSRLSYDIYTDQNSCKLKYEVNNGNRFYVIHKKNEIYTQLVIQASLAFIALQSILYSNDYRDNKLSLDTTIDLSSTFFEFEDNLLNDGNLMNFLGRMNYQQYVWQTYKPKNSFARSIYLFLIYGEKSLSELSFSTLFAEKYSLTIRDYLAAGLILSSFVIAFKDPFHQSDIESYIDINGRTKYYKNIIITLQMISCRYSVIRDRYDALYNIDNMEKCFLNYNNRYNPLRYFPIINFDKNQDLYVIPNLQLFFEKISNGVYWILRNELMSPNSTQFTNEFGARYDSYIGVLLKHYFQDAEQIVDLDEIKKDKNLQIKVADWLVEFQDYVLIIESKSSLTSLSIKESFDNNFISKWFNKNIKKAMEQLTETVKYFQKSLSNKKIYTLVIFYEDLQLLNGKGFIRDNRVFPELQNLHFITLREFEQIEKGVKEFGINKILDQKENIIKGDIRFVGHDLVSVQEHMGCTNTENTFLINLFNKFVAGLERN